MSFSFYSKGCLNSFGEENEFSTRISNQHDEKGPLIGTD